MKFFVRVLALLALLTAPAAHADGLIDNVNGITLDDKGQVIHFTGITFNRDGMITGLYGPKNKRPKKLEWRIDAGGKTLVPGMIDAHGHVMEYGFKTIYLDLSETRSLAEAQAKIAAYAAAIPSSPFQYARTVSRYLSFHSAQPGGNAPTW